MAIRPRGGKQTRNERYKRKKTERSIIRTTGEDIEPTGATEADFDFIASARSDMPQLVDEVRRLRGGLAATLSEDDLERIQVRCDQVSLILGRLELGP